MADGRHLGKIEKTPIAWPRFDGLQPHLARRHSSTLFSRPMVKNLKNPRCGGRHLEKLKKLPYLSRG